MGDSAQHLLKSFEALPEAEQREVLEQLVPIVPGILKELNHIPPKSLRKIGA